MQCDVAARALYAGESGPELEVHLSACDDCRLLAEDVAQLRRAFDRARAEWAPSARFRVRLPHVPWRKLAIAACLLVVPMAALAISSIQSRRLPYDMEAILEPASPPAPATDREVLDKLLFPEENS